MQILASIHALFRSKKLVLSIFAILLFSLGNFFPQTALAAPVSTKPHTQKTTFTLDGVVVTVDTPFLPESHFSTSQPGDATQTAVAATSDPKVHPYGAISITAVPFGTKPKSEGVPIAQAGGAAAYRASLHRYRVQEDDNPQPGPVISIFGQHVAGEASLMPGDTRRASSSTLVVEWVAQAGKRIWIVRITQEEPIGTVDLKPASSLLASLSFLTITSSTLAYPTTVKVTRASGAAAKASLSNLPYPDWWSGTCVDRSGGFGSGSYPLGASYRGMVACGPTGTAVFSTFGGRNYPGVSEWQCVELAMRYFVLTGWAPIYPGNGVNIVHNYPNSSLTQFPTIRNGSQQLSIQGKPFQAGDVLSWADMANNTTPNMSSPGHVSIVTGVTVNSSGNGSFSVIEENSVASGTETFSINNWLLQDSTWTDSNGFHRQRILDWLDPNSGGPGGPGGSGLASAPAVAYNVANNYPEVFARGTDNGIWHDYPSSTGFWTNWTSTQSGLQFQGSPAVIWNAGQNHLEVFALGSDGNIWHDWPLSNGSWANWGQTQSGLHFQGTPTVAYNVAGNYPEVFALGSDGNIWHDWPSSDGSWANWTQTQSGGLQFQGSPAVIWNAGANHLEVFVLGVDGQIWHDWPSSDGGWNNWSVTQSGLHFQGTPTVAYNVAGNYPEVFALGTDGTIWHDWPALSNGWNNWTQTQSGLQFQGSPAVIWNAGQNHLEVFALGTDGTIWHDWPASGGSWTNWTQTQSGLQFQSSPTVAYNVAPNYPEVFALGTDGTIWHDWPSPGGGWTNWAQTQSLQFQ